MAGKKFLLLSEVARFYAGSPRFRQYPYTGTWEATSPDALPQVRASTFATLCSPALAEPQRSWKTLLIEEPQLGRNRRTLWLFSPMTWGATRYAGN